MAQWLNQDKPDPGCEPGDGFNAMGKPIPLYRRENGYRHCIAMGLSKQDAVAAVSGCAEQLERDNSYEAQGKAMIYLDLTGAYRLMAALLTGYPIDSVGQPKNWEDPVV